jgi:DNA-binding MarR family transcriptional regulator
VAELDEVIHQSARLRIMATLVALKSGEAAEFTYLRELLDLTDGNLGAHLKRLEDAAYVEVEKDFVDRKPRSYVKATARGRTAFRGHVAALEDILRLAGKGR